MVLCTAAVLTRRHDSGLRFAAQTEACSATFFFTAETHTDSHVFSFLQTFRITRSPLPLWNRGATRWTCNGQRGRIVPSMCTTSATDYCWSAANYMCRVVGTAGWSASRFTESMCCSGESEKHTNLVHRMSHSYSILPTDRCHRSSPLRAPCSSVWFHKEDGRGDNIEASWYTF